MDLLLPGLEVVSEADLAVGVSDRLSRVNELNALIEYSPASDSDEESSEDELASEQDEVERSNELREEVDSLARLVLKYALPGA